MDMGLFVCFWRSGERYMSGVGQVEPFEEVRREIIHQLSIRPMAHSELVKALPENVRHLSVCLSVGLSVCSQTVYLTVSCL